MIELELHQLDLRYEGLRSRCPKRERQLLASLAEIGQQLPIVVVASAGEAVRYVVIDGYKRVRALKRLARDTVRATLWEVGEAEALLLERLMRTASAEGALEQGWLLKELSERFGLSLDELARRFDKSKSWVSRRLALVAELPKAIQEQVHAGALSADAAMKYLVPLSRGNAEQAVQLAVAMAPLKPSTRQVKELCAGLVSGGEKTRELILSDPGLYLRAQEEGRRAQEAEKTPAQQLADDLGALGGVSRRALRRLQQGLWQGLLAGEREEVARRLRLARGDAQALFDWMEKEAKDARPEHARGDSSAA